MSVLKSYDDQCAEFTSVTSPAEVQQLAPTFTLASRQASASRDPIVESRAATTELLEMQRKCEALEEENRKLGSFRKSKMDPLLRVELSCWC